MSEAHAADLEAEAERLASYLAGRGLGFWSVGSRAVVLEHLLQALADLGARAEDRPSRPVPSVPPHAYADLLLVLAHDLRTAAPGHGRLAEQGLAEIVVHRADLAGGPVPRAWQETVRRAGLTGCPPR